MNAGSFFFAAIARTMSSLNPGGSVSDSMSVTNPAGYSRLISDSIELLIKTPVQPASEMFASASTKRPPETVNAVPEGTAQVFFHEAVGASQRRARHRALRRCVRRGQLTR